MITEVKEVKKETTGDSQNIHVHIHINNDEKGYMNNEKGYTNTFLFIIVLILGFVAASKYGLLDGLDSELLDNLPSIATLSNNLNPFPKATLPLSSQQTSSPLQQVSSRCFALDIGMELIGEEIPAADTNIGFIPKRTCHRGCMYEVIPDQARIGIQDGMMSYTGTFKPVGEVCQQQGQQNGIQKTFLAVIPLYMLGKYLLGEEKSDNGKEESPTTLPNFPKVPFLDEKIEEAKENLKIWLWGVSRVIILIIAFILLLSGILSSKGSRLILIIASIAMAWYAY